MNKQLLVALLYLSGKITNEEAGKIEDKLDLDDIVWWDQIVWRIETIIGRELKVSKK